MTYETNPAVLQVLYSTGKIASSQYLLKGEAEQITAEDLYVDANNSIFTGNTQITRFNEFKYFTGIKSLQISCFANMTNLREIVLPESITTIGRDALSNTALTEIYIPANVKTIDMSAFSYSHKLTNIAVDALNG